MPAAATAGAGKAVGKNAAVQILAEGLANIRLGVAVFALPIELALAGQFDGQVSKCPAIVWYRSVRSG